MEFLILLYGDEAGEEALPKEELRAITQRHHEYGALLRADGKLVYGTGLRGTDSATTMRRGNGQITDGPYADTKEQIGGFYLVDCADLDEAMDIAKKVPDSPGLTLEIRPTGG
ncbi:YciI family protein [Tenggerimyces flavus]|uniref:YciI family protein n=1 Tax=Tenggerimyces flavus TaxID=1708749 RepID=A0ABV7YPG0_9ACTN|nr:YciI family protein [Tenggerimyces flavus]MBM7787799.1 hypothetical protein [Tenggerimyces flavus]